VRIVLGVVAAAVVLGGACVGYEACDASQTRSAEASAWSAYGACLTGEPVAPGAHASEKLKALDLGRVEAEGASGDWPARCRRHVEALVPLLQSTARHDDRASAAASLASRLATPVDPTRVDPALVDSLSDALALLSLPVERAPSPADPAPPPPALPDITRAALTPLGTPGVGAPAAPDPLPSAALRLAWAATPPWTCRFEPGLARAHCFEPRGVPAGAELLPVAEDDAAPSTLLRVLFTTDTPAGVIRAEDGRRVADDWKLPAFVREDGAILEVAPVHAGSVLRRADDEIGLAIPGNASASAIASDALVWIDSDRLAARDVGKDGSLGPLVDVAPLPPGDHSIGMCHSRRTLVVRVTTGDRATTVFRTEHAWSAPVDSPRADRPASLACTDDEATLTWLDRDAAHQIACTPRGCASRQASLGAAWDVADVERDAVSVGKSVLVLRRATFHGALDSRPGEAVVTRFAAVGDLPAARERILVADAGHGGIDPVRIQAFARDGVAAVVVTARDGVAWAMRVGAEGDVRPVAVSR
jgi:hypothetical protein